MKYQQFQNVVGRSDPRSILLFYSPYGDVFPHVVVQSEELSIELWVYKKDCGENFLSVFHEAFDTGKWLVVDDIQSVDYNGWRVVGTTLASALPEAAHRMRKHFRLFSFVAEDVLWQQVLPSLTNQFCLHVDTTGGVTVRSELSPIFQGYSLFENSSEVTESLARASNLQQGKSSPYLSTSQAREMLLDEDTKASATNPEYIDEVLLALREVLIQEQQSFVWKIEANIAASIQKAEEATAKRVAEQRSQSFETPDDGGDGTPQKIDRDAIAAEEKKKAEEAYDWVYPRILEWAILQCPDADISALPEISSDDITQDSLSWKTEREMCFQGTWSGTGVMIKEPLVGYVVEHNQKLRSAFAREAATHYALRHPFVLTLYGLSEGKMLMESGLGTLEQALIRARYEAQRWTVRQFLQVARQVLSGLQYLSAKVIHRDIACRSVIETTDKKFKVGQFQCAMPIAHSTTEAHSGMIPIRWTSPEGLVHEFVAKSDVWSFGVMMWEAVQYATETPYSQFDQAAHEIARGVKLEAPVRCPPQLYSDVILPCFELSVEQRPTASKMMTIVSKALVQWPEQLLFSVVPFPTDIEGFEEYNKKNPPRLPSRGH